MSIGRSIRRNVCGWRQPWHRPPSNVGTSNNEIARIRICIRIRIRAPVRNSSTTIHIWSRICSTPDIRIGPHVVTGHSSITTAAAADAINRRKQLLAGIAIHTDSNACVAAAARGFCATQGIRAKPRVRGWREATPDLLIIVVVAAAVAVVVAEMAERPGASS